VFSEKVAEPILHASKSEADSAYAKEDFHTAAQLYTLLLDSCGSSAQLFYNLGNCYYRQDSIARAILCYERARLLDPSDDDIRMNLEMARAKTVDRVMPASEMFFASLFHRLVLSMSLQTWAWLGILTFILMLAALAAYIFLPTLTGKKVGFTVAVVSLFVCLFANIAAYQQLHKLENRDNAVIMSSSVVVKSTPSQSGTDLFILHEGTRVEIVDDTMKEWVEIVMSDGKEGWIQRADIEII
jgi:tetratricopeptide (TPR) repeat protein